MSPIPAKRLLVSCGALCLAWLGGCAAMPDTSPWPAMSALPESEPVTQRLTFHHGGKTQQLLGILRHDARSLTLVVLSPQGQRLLTLDVDDEQAHFLADAAFEPPFSADWLASRLIWSLWPEPSLTAAFAGTPWRLEQEGTTRDVSYRGTPVVRIERHPHCLSIDDRQGRYRLQIERLQTATLGKASANGDSPNKDASNNNVEGSCPTP